MTAMTVVQTGISTTEAFMQIFIRVIDLKAFDYNEFADICRRMPEQWSVPEVVDPSFAQSVGYKIVSRPDPRQLMPWETATLVGRKNGTTFSAQWEYSDLPDAEAIKKAGIAAKRYEVETGGVTLNGVLIPTDRETRRELTAVYVRAKADPSHTVRFKMYGEFVTLNAEQIIAIGDAVYDHVQAAFDREAELLDVTGATFLDW